MGTRKIIVCFDGTGNEVGDRESNILRLYKGLIDGRDQIPHYVPGIGTLEGPRLIDWALPRNFRSLTGLAFGMGLENDVLDAYAFLCRSYQSQSDKTAAASAWRREMRRTAATLNLPKPEFSAPPAPPQRDQIYIFGFSRGAYAARILAGFIHNFGLVEPEKLHVIADAFRAYRAITAAERAQDPDVTFRRLRQYTRAFRPRAAPIRALGLFDTVASMVRLHRPIRSLIRYGSIMELGSHANVRRNPSVRIVLQALALDERRTMYRPLTWRRTGYWGNRFQRGEPRQQYVEQRWFPGYHSDIGGSATGAVGIGKLTLSWMLHALTRAEAAADAEDGLSGDLTSRPLRLTRSFRTRHLLPDGPPPGWTPDCGWENPHAMAPLHNSMSPAWMTLEAIPKTRLRREWPNGPTGPRWYLPLGEPRLVPPGHVADASIAARMRGHATYNPINAPAPENRAWTLPPFAEDIQAPPPTASHDTA